MMIIYKITNNINNKSYIGQTTKDLEERKESHYYAIYKDKNFAIHKAILKYGWENFKWEILEKCDSKEELDEMEFHFIKQYDTFISKNGYNMTWGGEGSPGKIFTEDYRKKLRIAQTGKKLSQETKEKLRKIMKGRVFTKEWKKKIGESNKGKIHPHTEETKKKISNSMLGNKNHFFGKHHTEETKEKIRLAVSGNKSILSKRYIITTPSGEEIKVHGIRKFCREFKDEKLTHNLLISCVKGIQNHHKGYKCRYDTN